MQLRFPLAFAVMIAVLSTGLLPAADAPEKKGPRPGAGGKGPGKGGFGKGGPGGADFKAKLLEKFDTNKDGQLSDDEKQAAKAAFEKRRAEGGGKGPAGKGGPGGRFGGGKFGGKGGGEFMKKLDKNGDGKLDDAEKQAAREAFGKNRPEKK